MHVALLLWQHWTVTDVIVLCGPGALKCTAMIWLDQCKEILSRYKGVVIANIPGLKINFHVLEVTMDYYHGL